MLLDIFIILFLISAIYRGRELGFARQLLATAGFFGGLFLGAWLQPHVARYTSNQLDRAILAIVVSISSALLFLLLGEYVGLHIKKRVLLKPVNRLDVVLGGFLNVVATLLAVWLMASLAGGLPITSVQNEIHDSRIIRAVNNLLPPAPGIISRLGKLIDPNGFPQVFIGNEPAPAGNVNLPSLGDLASAVQKDRASVVKIQGVGCGGIVDGSGFVAAPGVVATNAHVVAGIRNPYVQDAGGTHRSSVIYFDPNRDFALLRANGLVAPALPLSGSVAGSGTPGVVLGYPGGGAFSANAAAIMDTILAEGRNIYGSGRTVRQVYEIHATVVPGNSGGPLVARDGTVLGVVFAESTSYQQVGYALTSPTIAGAVSRAASLQTPVSTAQCAED